MGTTSQNLCHKAQHPQHQVTYGRPSSTAPNTSCPRSSTLLPPCRVGSVGAVGPGAQLFSGYHIVLQASLNLREQQVGRRAAKAPPVARSQGCWQGRGVTRVWGAARGVQAVLEVWKPASGPLPLAGDAYVASAARRRWPPARAGLAGGILGADHAAAGRAARPCSQPGERMWAQGRSLLQHHLFEASGGDVLQAACSCLSSSPRGAVHPMPSRSCFPRSCSPTARGRSTVAARSWETTSQCRQCPTQVGGWDGWAVPRLGLHAHSWAGGGQGAWRLLLCQLWAVDDPSCQWPGPNGCLPGARHMAAPPGPAGSWPLPLQPSRFHPWDARPADWLAGESRTFYVYHQMATGELYHIKCDAPRQAGSNLPIVSCTQVRVAGRAGGEGWARGRGRQGREARLHGVLAPLLVGQSFAWLYIRRGRLCINSHTPACSPSRSPPPPQAVDNSKGPGGSPGVTDELQLALINLTGRTIPAGTTNVFFNLAVATLGSP